MSNTNEPLEIAIVGAGYSGTMVAAHLLRQARTPLTVRLFERDPSHFGRGIAYSTPMDCHLLNVPAGNMSAFPDEPDHFLRWAEARAARLVNPPWVESVGPQSFLPRRAYGDYLADTLDAAEGAALPGVRLERRAEKVARLSVEPDQAVKLRLEGGQVFRAKRAVLAVGNFPPGNPRIADPGFYASRRYHRNPWLPRALEKILATESCLLIGSGLTMADWVVTLERSGYRGKIHVVSRRGLWPKVHELGPPAAFALDPAAPPKVREWLRQVREHIASSGDNWRAVIDALRPRNQALWQSLPLEEQRRFLRHARPFWDLHRHRLAPPVAAKLESLVASGQVVRHAGQVTEYWEGAQDVDVLIRLRGSAAVETLRVDAVVNCSGSESNYRRLESALVRSLLEQGLIRPDALNLGIAAAPDGAVVDAAGVASALLYTLGPPQKGMLWETTAVPEVRWQAQRLAALLLDKG